jgi:hypothetical protein
VKADAVGTGASRLLTSRRESGWASVCSLRRSAAIVTQLVRGLGRKRNQCHETAGQQHSHREMRLQYTSTYLQAPVLGDPCALRKPDSPFPQTLPGPSLTPDISDILFATNETTLFCKMQQKCIPSEGVIAGRLAPISIPCLLVFCSLFLSSDTHTHTQLLISQHFTSYYQSTSTLQPLELPLRHYSSTHILSPRSSHYSRSYYQQASSQVGS